MGEGRTRQRQRVGRKKGWGGGKKMRKTERSLGLVPNPSSGVPSRILCENMFSLRLSVSSV